MPTLASDEKSTVVMVYTQNALIRGDLVTKETVRVSILLRTDSAPRFFYLQNVQMVFFGGGPARSSNYPEMYVPIASVIGFHIAPPAQEPLDYEADEKNRAEEILTAGVGTFLFKGKVRYSAHGGLASSMQMTHNWLSMYDVDIINPSLPQMPSMRVRMLQVHPGYVTFAL